MQTKDTEVKTAEQEEEDRQKALAAFRVGAIGLKGLVAPDPIDRYEIERTNDAAEFIGFVVEQTATGIAQCAKWAFRRLRR